MKDVPENISDNPHLEALQNIIYDEDPDIVAESLNVYLFQFRNKVMKD